MIDFPVEEMDGSPVEVATVKGLAATRIFFVPWDKRLVFAQHMLFQDGDLSRFPVSYPGFPSCRVDQVAIKNAEAGPLGQPDIDIYQAVNNYQFAEVTVTYKTSDDAGNQLENDNQDYDPRFPEGTWATYRQSTTAQMMTLPGRYLFWKDYLPEEDPTYDTEEEEGEGGEEEGEVPRNQLPEDAGGGLLISLTDHIINWKGVVRPPWSAIAACKGKVNATAFVIPVTGQVVAAETLLFEGCETDTEFKYDPTQPRRWSLTYTFKEKSGRGLSMRSGVPGLTWNRYFRKFTAQWEDVVNKEGDPTYALADFNTLFQLAVS